MQRKRFILGATAVLLLAAAIITYIGLSGGRTAPDADQALQESTMAAAAAGATAGASASEETGETAVPSPQIIKSEKIDIAYNSPEYDLEAALCEDSEDRAYVSLEYYLDGTGTDMEADNLTIPELAGIFEKRGGAGSAADGYRVRAAYLNPVYSRLYLQLAGGASDGFEDTALYSLDLENKTVKKLFSYRGRYSKMVFNRDFSMLCYSFDDPPQLSNFQESSLFDILDCKNDEFKVRGSRTPSNKPAGGRAAEYLYDYGFIAWKSDTVVRLKQAVFPKEDVDGKPVLQGEVLYDTVKDVVTNVDGSPAEIKPDARTGGAPAKDTQAEAPPAQEAPAAVKGGEEASKALSDFYSFLSSEKDYKKAMELLDGDFKLQLELLKQFGATEIIKSDIDVEGASMYSAILKAAKLDSIVKVELAGDTYTVYYYQTLSLNTDSQVRQALEARLKKVKGAYKILLVKDADEEKPPFALQKDR